MLRKLGGYGPGFGYDLPAGGQDVVHLRLQLGGRPLPLEVCFPSFQQLSHYLVKYLSSITQLLRHIPKTRKHSPENELLPKQLQASYKEAADS